MRKIGNPKDFSESKDCPSLHVDGVGVVLLSYRMVWWVRCPQVRRIKLSAREIFLLVMPSWTPNAPRLPSCSFLLSPSQGPHLPSSHADLAVQMKNNEPLVFDPAFTMGKMPRSGRFRINVHPQISLCRWNCHQCHYDV